MSGIIVTPETRYVGRRKRIEYRATLGPVTVVYSTKKLASDELVKTVETLISGSFEPALYTYAGRSVVVYRMLEGWCYRVYEGVTASTMESAPSVTVQVGQSDRKAAIRSARKHLAQMAYPHFDALDLLVGDDEAILDHLHWIGFQRAYAEHQFSGHADQECHTFACAHADDDRMFSFDELAARTGARTGYGKHVF